MFCDAKTDTSVTGRYLLIDDGWQASESNAKACRSKVTGALLPDRNKFPDMAATAAYVHSKKMKIGLWMGHQMCAFSNDLALGQPDYAAADAAQFLEWKIDAVKHDACDGVNPGSPAEIEQNYQRYKRLGAAMNKTGRPILYDVVLQAKTTEGHGLSLPHFNYGSVWSPELYGGKQRMHALGNMWWSLPVNKYDCWQCCVTGMTMLPNETACRTNPRSRAALRGVMPMIDSQDSGRPGFSFGGHWNYSEPGGWNHLDQLAVCLPRTWQGP
jgi:hypothetical protein